MNRPLRHPLFVFALLFYGFLFLMKKTGLYFPLVSDYGADFLAFPVIFPLSLYLMQRIHPSGETYRLKIWQMAFSVVLFSILFEWLFPRLTPRFTADPWDIIAYLAGALLFAVFQQRESMQKKNR